MIANYCHNQRKSHGIGNSSDMIFSKSNVAALNVESRNGFYEENF